MSEPGKVQTLFAEKQPVNPDTLTPSLVDMAQAVATIAATRMLLLIAVLTGAAIWIWTIYDPSQARLYAAIAFSVVFVIPQTLLYFRKG
jgi:hypothetical protein